MKIKPLSVPVLVMGVALLANAQGSTTTATKVGIIHIQNAILSTKDGQKAATDQAAIVLPAVAVEIHPRAALGIAEVQVGARLNASHGFLVPLSTRKGASGSISTSPSGGALPQARWSGGTST